MRIGEPELAADVRAVLGEGPVWDDRKQLLYWVDIMEKRIYRQEEETRDVQHDQLDTYIGALALRKSGGLALATQQGFCMYDTETKRLVSVSDPESDKPDNRFNDGKCDPAGRFLAGTMSMANQRNAGALYRLDPDRSTHVLLRDVSTSNGLAWSPDHKTMYYIDTPTLCVTAFAYDLETGKIGEPKELIRFPASEGYPDGMTIDEEGCVWIAHWRGFQVSRWNPATGQKIASVPLPVPLVTSCTFGGANGDELYITSAKVGLSEEDLQKYPLSGSLFKVKTDVRGGITYAYAG